MSHYTLHGKPISSNFETFEYAKRHMYPFGPVLCNSCPVFYPGNNPDSYVRGWRYCLACFVLTCPECYIQDVYRCRDCLEGD